MEGQINIADMEEVIQQNFHQVWDRIDRAARQSGRDPGKVKLVVVTKGQPMEKIRAVLVAGAQRLGENYVEEAASKMQELKSEPRPEWHMIGHIQSRKARSVCELFDYIHSLDSLKLAARLNRFAGELGRRMPVLLEFNISGEATKSGFQAWDKSMWSGLITEIKAILEFRNLVVSGLMVMPPYDPDPDSVRPYFRLGRELRDYLSKHVSQGTWRELSMGMSNDFEVAIQEGATFVRIGEAILGKRQ